MRDIAILTGQAGLLMFQKAMEKEAKRQLSTEKGIWQQLEENHNKARYEELTLDKIKEALGSCFGKTPKKRIRRKMKKTNRRESGV